jgi:hypothetical protein
MHAMLDTLCGFLADSRRLPVSVSLLIAAPLPKSEPGSRPALSLLPVIWPAGADGFGFGLPAGARQAL